MSGSEKRQRGQLLQVRLSDEEMTKIVDDADRRGLSAASHAREILLATKAIRSVRRPPIDRTAVSQLLAVLGETASDLRTIARSNSLASYENDREKLHNCLCLISEMRDALMGALHRQL